ncbi:ABC-2 transporter permease [Lederbergia lenta]|uniref:ABC-2 transporter permease n=1 Tax=Lederbergia lenta TaxID=1467 RepID=UPI00203E8FCE|nr:ABC-2 transporter permease [Lederbergia lenta]MCM3111002.1 ABC-2 transporter permease [Lederbergia lenta]
MKQLILKDLYTQKGIGFFFPPFFAFMIFINHGFIFGTGNFFLIATTFAAIWLSVVSNYGIASIDLLQKRFITSLPVTRNKIVQAKYLASFVWWGISFLFFGFIYIMIVFTTSESLNLPDWHSIIFSLGIMSISISFFYLIYFSLGYLAAIFITMPFVLFGFFGVEMLLLLIEIVVIPGITHIIFLAVCFLITALSYWGAVRFFERKDI